MKQWVHKLIDQFQFDEKNDEFNSENALKTDPHKITEDRASLLYILDHLNKHLFEIKGHPIRKVRSTIDEFAKELIKPDNEKSSRLLYRFREFYSNYRLDEYTYMNKTVSDFKSIIWDFVEQISEDLVADRASDMELKDHLEDLKEAVESDSLEKIKKQSHEFIDSYTAYQTKKENRQMGKFKNLSVNLHKVKKQLLKANDDMRRDHLTHAFNRKSFDEQFAQYYKLHRLSRKPVSLLMLDIDHFKKVNDTYGHAIGDFVLIELVKLLNSLFSRDLDLVARVGGEEFAILLPDYNTESAVVKVEEVLDRVRKAVFVQDDMKIQFTVSVGISELTTQANTDQWLKAADEALYESKNTGRNKYTVAGPKKLKVA